jgi:hypothetical protein
LRSGGQFLLGDRADRRTGQRACAGCQYPAPAVADLVAQKAASGTTDHDAGSVALQLVAFLNLYHAGALDPADFGAHDNASGGSLDHVGADLTSAGSQAKAGGQRQGDHYRA